VTPRSGRCRYACGSIGEGAGCLSGASTIATVTSTYDYPSSEAAQAAAIEKCGDTCKKVVTTNKGRVALAVDGRKPCGPNGYVNAPKLGAAQNTALQHCYKYGGKDCVIRAWICDGKKG
jgi:hypothetical protein